MLKQMQRTSSSIIKSSIHKSLYIVPKLFLLEAIDNKYFTECGNAEKRGS